MAAPRAPAARVTDPDALVGDRTRIRARVLQGIAANRVPGFHFPGHFLDIRWAMIAEHGAVLEVRDDAHARNAAGSIDRTVLAVLADTAVGTAARLTVAAGARLGTVQLHLQFTDAPAHGDVVAEAAWRGPGAGTGTRTWLGAATLRANGKPVCYATGDFMQLDPPPGLTLAPLPWQRPDAIDAPVVDEDSMTAPERAVLVAADRALARATADAPFIEQFWGGERQVLDEGEDLAQRRLSIGPHLSNRVGHVQGGILLGIAAATACDAAPATMSLANLSACYIRPGRGDALGVRSKVVHAGRTTVVVRTQVACSDGSVALEATTQHAARAAPCG